MKPKFILLLSLLLTSCLSTGIVGENASDGAVFTLPEGVYFITSAASIKSFSPDVCVFNTLANGAKDLQLTCELESLTSLFVETSDFVCAAPKGQILQQDTCIDLAE